MNEHLVETVETKAAGIIQPKQGINKRMPYAHQRDALKAMTALDKNFPAYSTLIVLPIGGQRDAAPFERVLVCV